MSLIERTISISFQHRVFFAKNIFGLSNSLLMEVLVGGHGQVPKALVAIDESLHLAVPALNALSPWQLSPGTQGMTPQMEKQHHRR